MVSMIRSTPLKRCSELDATLAYAKTRRHRPRSPGLLASLCPSFAFEFAFAVAIDSVASCWDDGPVRGSSYALSYSFYTLFIRSLLTPSLTRPSEPRTSHKVQLPPAKRSRSEIRG